MPEENFFETLDSKTGTSTENKTEEDFGVPRVEIDEVEGEIDEYCEKHDVETMGFRNDPYPGPCTNYNNGCTREEPCEAAIKYALRQEDK